MKVRTTVKHEDIENVKRITESTGFFYDHEVEVAISLVIDTLSNPEEYSFVLIEDDNGKTIAFTNFGEIPCTHKRFDIYWIVVDNEQRGKGLGKILIAETEKRIRELGGEIAYLETSSTEKYLPTRKFYESLKYDKEVVMKDFYANGDDKVIYSKRLK